MAFSIRKHPVTTEEKLSMVVDTLSTIHDPIKAENLRKFIIDLCKRYVEKNDELSRYVSPSIREMDKFETEYVTRILHIFS